MNETFVRARTIFDRMMEETLARHTGSESFVTFPFWFPNVKLFTLCLVYEQPFHPSQHPQGRPNSRGGA